MSPVKPQVVKVWVGGGNTWEFAGVPGPRMSAHMIVTRRRVVLELIQARRVKRRVTVSKVQTPHEFPVHYHLTVRRAFVSMSPPSENRLIYLEDLEQPSSQATAASTNEEKPSVVAASSDHGEDAKTKVTPSTASNTSNGKRQRTLVDMFGSTSSKGSETPSKRPKVATGAASNSRDKPSAASATGAQLLAGGSSSGQQALNSIPFSLSEYTTSLTEDQKRLLNLECETMGKSW